MPLPTNNGSQPKKKTTSDLIVTSRQLINGWTSNGAMSTTHLWSLYPIQMLYKHDKTNEWKAWNMDWFERRGYEDISKEWRGLSKDYDAAAGILNAEDYGCDSPEYGDWVSQVVTEGEEPGIPAMFFPIIPPFVNLFLGEYAKRDRTIIAKAVDEYSTNEKFQYKLGLVTNVLKKKVLSDIQKQYEGVDIEKLPEEEQQKIQERIQQEQALAETETQFKTYQTIGEKWANKMIAWDDVRFNMKELELLSFRDAIVSDKTFIHIRQLADDILPEVWNPKYTFYHKPPDNRWVSESNYAGRIYYGSLSDIFKNYSEMLEDEHYDLLANDEPFASVYQESKLINLVDGVDYGDKSLWTDYSKKHPESITDVTAEKALLEDSVKRHLKEASLLEQSKIGGTLELDDLINKGLFRVTEVYWKSYKKEGLLTFVNKAGILESDTVDEDYKITEEPVYDNSIVKKKTKDNLVSGEHIDWYYKPEIRFGVKISRSLLNGSSTLHAGGFYNSIYLGGDPIDLQMGKLPVEGLTMSDRNTKSISWVRMLAPYQICFNIINNQNIDMLSNSLANGKVVMVDQNFIPRKSFDGSWGKHAMQKWLDVMRTNNLALMDGSPTNNPSGTGFSHFQVLDFSNTQDILRNIQLGEYFKNQALATIGITPQRMGTIAASESATGVRVSQSNSYAQTEYMFEKHKSQFIPRVRQIMLEMEQYMASTKPNVRIPYASDSVESAFFELKGSDLLLPEIKLYAMTDSETKELVEKMHNIAMSINTAGAEFSDYMKILNSKSPSTIIEEMEKSEAKRRENAERQRQHEQELLSKQQEQERMLKERELENENYKHERELETKILIAQINELGGIQTDVNTDGEIDSIENFREFNRNREEYSKIRQKETEMSQNKKIKDKEILLKEKEMASKERIENTKLKVAKENKNKYDFKNNKK